MWWDVEKVEMMEFPPVQSAGLGASPTGGESDLGDDEEILGVYMLDPMIA